MTDTPMPGWSPWPSRAWAHYPTSLPVALQAQLLLPDLDPGMVLRILSRAGYSTVEEREAELLASLIRQRARCHVSGTLTDRLHAALDDSDYG
jgi:hypothetical protein